MKIIDTINQVFLEEIIIVVPNNATGNTFIPHRYNSNKSEDLISCVANMTINDIRNNLIGKVSTMTIKNVRKNLIGCVTNLTINDVGGDLNRVNASDVQVQFAENPDRNTYTKTY